MGTDLISNRGTGVYLPNENAVRRLRAAVARAAWSGSPAKILFKGDSTTYGTIGGGGNGASAQYNPASLTSPPAISWVDRARRLLNVTQEMGGRIDEGPIWAVSATNDTRFTLGTGWTGGGSWSATTSTAGTLTFADTGASNNSYDFLIQKTSGTTLTVPVTIDAETTVTLTLTGQSLNTMVSYRATSTVGLGAHSVVVGAPVGGNITIYAINGTNSTTPPVATFSRNGVSGQQLSTFMSGGSTGAGGQYWTSHTQYVPDATVLLMGINDLHFSADSTIAAAAATYKTNLVSYVTTTQALGADVILGVFPSSGYAAAQLSPGAGEAVRFHKVIYEVADQYNCAVIDFQRRWGYGAGPITYTGTPTPTPMYDGTHPTIAGYQDMARTVSRFFAQVV